MSSESRSLPSKDRFDAEQIKTIREHLHLDVYKSDAFDKHRMVDCLCDMALASLRSETAPIIAGDLSDEQIAALGQNRPGAIVRVNSKEAKDAARLDFCEEKAATVYCSLGGHWVFVDERGKKPEDRRGILGASIRDCIDAAMRPHRHRVTDSGKSK